MTHQYMTHPFSRQRYFGRVWVCKVRDDWCQSAYRGTFPTSGEQQNWTAFEVSSFAPTSLELTLLQVRAHFFWGFLLAGALIRYDVTFTAVVGCR